MADDTKGFFEDPQVDVRTKVAGDDLQVYESDYEEGYSDGVQGIAAFRRSLVDECCTGVVVNSLFDHVKGFDHPGHAIGEAIPIASVGSFASLAGKVAKELAGRPIDTLGMSQAHAVPTEVLYRRCPPFAAAVSETRGVRTYHLASAACPYCEGGQRSDEEESELPCRVCSGTNACVDVGKIAARHGAPPEDCSPTAAKFTEPS